ncbi:hypothetical protein KYK29_02545 [Shinella daejeonensis]|uniref:hypothetical protein n=1 Tax=Shinella daejeonensis TaxID=659017 RepID=UPI0020C81C0C|nr:hypothetical protein [Shinella daejeonensis]MCP8893793.1 hypothetical protein [Shinella daejeonensis]
MNKMVTLVVSSMLAVSPLAGVAYAQETMPADTMSTGAISTDSIRVVNIGSMEGDSNLSADLNRLQSKMNTPGEVEKTQAELANDPALEAALAAQNVQLQNVVDIQSAADGSRIVYVK